MLEQPPIREGKRVKKGWGYVRVSTADQALVQHGSPEQQRHMLERYVQYQSERVGVTYLLERVVSDEMSGRAKSLHKRSGYHELLRAVRSKKVDFVVFEKIDRLHRDIIENQVFMQTCLENEVEVHEVESNGQIQFRDRGSRLGFNLKSMMAQEYSLDLEEKIAKKQREARVNNKKDVQTMPILGIDPNPTKRGFYQINPDEQSIVLDIFHKFIECASLSVVVDYCDKRGYRTKVRMTRESVDREGNVIPPRRVGGLPFDHRSLRQLLVSPKIAGFGYFKDDWNQFPNRQDEAGLVRFEYAHGPVIPLDVFARAQEILASNKKYSHNGSPDRRAYLLSGVFVTPDGVRFHGCSATSKTGEKHHYYFNATHKIRVPADRIEERVVEEVIKLYSQGGAFEKALNDGMRQKSHPLYVVSENITRLKKEIAERQVRLDCIRQMEMIAMQNPSATAEFKNEIVSFWKKQEDIEKEMKPLVEQLNLEIDKQNVVETELRKEVVADRLQKRIEMFRKGGSAIRKRIIQAVTPKIILLPDNRLEILVNPLNTSECHTMRQKVRECSEWRPFQETHELFSSFPYLLVTTTDSLTSTELSDSFLNQEYVSKGLSLRQIAAQTFSSKEAVRKRLVDAAIPLREPHRPHGHLSQPKYGEKVVGGRVTPHLTEQKLVDTIRKMRAEGLSLRKIATLLSSMAIPTKERGKAWHPEMVSRILKNYA